MQEDVGNWYQCLDRVHHQWWQGQVEVLLPAVVVTAVTSTDLLWGLPFLLWPSAPPITLFVLSTCLNFFFFILQQVLLLQVTLTYLRSNQCRSENLQLLHMLFQSFLFEQFSSSCSPVFIFHSHRVSAHVEWPDFCSFLNLTNESQGNTYEHWAVAQHEMFSWV